MPTQDRPDRQKVVIVAGPTASGKTAAALQLAEKFPFEIINADSMQVYRHMAIGTSKPDASLIRRVPHHLMSIVNPDEPFNAADYMKLGRHTIAEIAARNRIPLVVGGTGLYIKALTKGLFFSPGADAEIRQGLETRTTAQLFEKLQTVDPLQAQKLNPGDRRRIIRGLEVFSLTGKPISRLQSEHRFSDSPYTCLKIGLSPERRTLYHRIDRRVDEMIQQGLVAEVQTLLSMGYPPDIKPMQSIGYRQIVHYLQGGISLHEAVDAIKQQTRNYAKRQLTWFRKDEEMIWFNPDEPFALVVAQVKNFLNN